MKLNYKKLGEYIEPCDQLNDRGEISLLQGISNEKHFQGCKSNKNGIDLTRYRICKHGWFAYNRATTRNGDKISIAYRDGEDCLVSPSYKCFKIKDENKLLHDYLLLWFKRPEFDRYARFKSHGSAHEYFEYEEMCNVELPVPAIEQQHKIVWMYQTIEKRIKLKKTENDILTLQIETLFKKLFVKNMKYKENRFIDVLEDIISGDWGKDSPQGNNKEEVYCIRGADIPTTSLGMKDNIPIRYILSKNFQSKKLNIGDIVVEISGGSPTQSTGRTTRISESLYRSCNAKIICTNFCRAIRPKKEYSIYMYCYWQYLYNKGVCFSYENGTTGIKNFMLEDFISKEKIYIPEINKIRNFNNIVQPIIENICNNSKEQELLLRLQKIVLPKIMIGKTDI